MQSSEHTFRTWDDTQLFYRAWLPKEPATKAVILFHRGHEHSARWQETVERLGLEDFAVFAWDQRGHGRSPGARGSAPNIAAVIKDAECFVRHVAVTHGVPVENMAVIAHSVGAVIATGWVHDYAPPIRCLVLGAPAFRVKLYVPLAIPALRLKQRLLGPGYVKSYVKASVLTHDPEQARAYQADSAIFRQIAVNVLLDLFDVSTRLLADAGAITVPTLMFAAGSDWVVKNSAQRQFFDRLSSPTKHFEVLPNFYHALFHEKDRHLVVNRIRDFLRTSFAAPIDAADLLNADRAGYTKAEYDRLCQPGSIKWSLLRGSMSTIGKLSHGIRLGFRAGFDSGVMLDYIYRNRAGGTTPLGTMIDRNYIDAIGWRGIRQRKVNLESVLRDTLTEMHRQGRPLRVLDIATGAGRYVLETMHKLKHLPITAVLRDYKEENLDAARKLAAELGLSDKVTIVQGDAFDRASLAALDPKPTIGIVSGLYELFPENEPVRRSLHGMADALAPAGVLIYTCQPWHPQVEFIARVLPNREGKPWIMRRRTQAEMDVLVRAAGFQKLRQEIDPWGIFTVAVARRMS